MTTVSPSLSIGTPRRTLSPIHTSLSPLRLSTPRSTSSPSRSNGTPMKSFHHHVASSTSVSRLTNSSQDIFSRHDLLIKQMDRQRAEVFQRIQERVQRAKNVTQQCSDQIHLLTSQIAQMEDKIAETREFHFKNVLLGSMTLSENDTESYDDDLEGDEEFNDVSLKASPMKATTNSMHIHHDTVSNLSDPESMENFDQEVRDAEELFEEEPLADIGKELNNSEHV